MPLTTNIAESSNIRQQKNSSSNIFLHSLTVALNLTIQDPEKFQEANMMQLLVIVLNKLECLDKLLTALEEEHIPGATILDSRGMAQQLEAHDELRFLGSLRCI